MVGLELFLGDLRGCRHVFQSQVIVCDFQRDPGANHLLTQFNISGTEVFFQKGCIKGVLLMVIQEIGKVHAQVNGQ